MHSQARMLFVVACTSNTCRQSSINIVVSFFKWVAFDLYIGKNCSELEYWSVLNWEQSDYHCDTEYSINISLYCTESRQSLTIIIYAVKNLM